ncbi:Os06g0680800, partial [Oryza sativa Japonica Group]
MRTPAIERRESIHFGHGLDVGLGDARGGADLGDDLAVELVLDAGVEDEVHHGPLQRGGAGVRAGAHHLGAERHQLVLAEPLPPPRRLQVEQRVHVRLAGRAHHLHAADHRVPVGVPLAAAPDELPARAHQRRQAAELAPPEFARRGELLGEERREEREEVRELGHGHHHHVLEHLLDLADELVGDLGAEADADEDAADGEAAVGHHPDGAGGGELGAEPPEVAPDGPLADPRESLHPRRRHDLGDEVAAERAPERAVRRRVDGALADAEEQPRRAVLGAAGERRALLDERVVDEVGVGDDDERALPHPHGEDGPVLLAEVAHHVHEGPPLEDHLEQVADHRPPRRPRREAVGAA